MAVKFELVDAPMDYNTLLGQNCIYAMKVILSSIFRVVCFPFEDHIVTIDQMYFDNSDSSRSLGLTISAIDNSQLETENVGFIMYLS